MENDENKDEEVIDENKGGLMMYLAFALVSTGLLLSFLPSHLTGSTPKKTA